MILIITIFLALLIYLFIFYNLSRDNFYFIRKGINMEQLYNVLFLGILVTILSAKFFYLVFNFIDHNLGTNQPHVLSELHGFSVFGVLTGFYMSYLFLTQRRKISRLRFLDIAALAFLAALPLISIGLFNNIYLLIMNSVLLLFFLLILMKKYNNGRLKTGSLSLIFLIMVSLIVFLEDIYLLYFKNILLSKESFALFGLFLISCILLIRLELRK